MQDLLGRGRHASDAEVAVQHDNGQMATGEEVVEVVIGLGKLGIAPPEFLIHRIQLFVGALQLFLGGLQLFVRALEFLVRREDFLAARAQLFVGRFALVDHRLEMLFGRLQLVAQRTRRGRSRPWRGYTLATSAPRPPPPPRSHPPGHPARLLVDGWGRGLVKQHHVVGGRRRGVRQRQHPERDA